ncbi:MAG: LTA synthase family protein [Filifactoraceae bacterium]
MGRSIFFAILSFFLVETTYNSIDKIFMRMIDRPLVFFYCLLFLFLFFNGLSKLKNTRTATILMSGFTAFLSLSNYITMRFNNKFFSFSNIAYLGDKMEVLSMFIGKLYSPALILIILCAMINIILSVLYKEKIEFDKLKKLPEINDKYVYISYEMKEPIIYNENLKLEVIGANHDDKQSNVNKKIDFMEDVEFLTDEIEHIVENFDNAVDKITKKSGKILFSSKIWGVFILMMMIILSQFIFSFDRFYFSSLMNTYKIINFETKDTDIYHSFNVPIKKYSAKIDNVIYEKPEKDVDIVVIQSEAFFDFSKIDDLEFSEEITKNFKKYQHEGMWGRSFVPVVGGMTCNSEFEFLTGIKIKDLYGYQMPYEEMPLMKIHSLADDFKNYGYETKAIHGYRRDFFRRNEIYPMLGIDEFIAEDNFKDAKYYGAWMSDNDIFLRILDELKEGEKLKLNQFIFSVTVQNHGPFSYKAPKDKVTVGNLYSEDKTSLENYASGIKISDISLGQFMEALEKREKETIVVFYGDHIFSSEHKIISEDPYFKENINNKYATDYFMWSNKGSIEEEEKDQSLLSLSRELKKQVLPLTYFDKFILDNYATEDDYFDGIDIFDHEAYKTVVNKVYSKENFDPVYLPIND